MNQGRKVVVISLAFAFVFAWPTLASAAVILDNATGGDCLTIGLWDAASKTCSLTKDISEPIEMGASGLTLDGAFYSGFLTDDEYVTIPDPLDGEYTIEVRGTDKGGEYTIATAYITDDASIENDLTSHILPGTSEETTLTLDSSQPDNTTIEDTTVITFPILIDHINQAYSLGWIKNAKFRDQLIKLVGAAQRGPKKNPKAFLAQKGVLLKRLRMFLEKGHIIEDGYNLLVEDINNLVDNL